MTDYATLVRESLAQSRRERLTFDIAWHHAMSKTPRPSSDSGWTPGVIDFAKVAFREGYYRRDVLGPAGILGEDFDDEPGVRSIGHDIGSLVA